jgi:tetraacyldisaccharide 4'-kinase
MTNPRQATPQNPQLDAASPRGPLPRWLAWLGPVASSVYGRVIARRNAAFDRGEGVVTFDRPVISVGNLSVGGTGKTPTVAWLATLLRANQHDPCIAMRGYASRGGLSDEARLYLDQFDDLPVVAQPNRTEGLIDLFATERGERIDCILLDDGFQHRRIGRALDLVLIDARRDPWQDRLLPAGWLRESPASLARAHAVLLTHAPDPGAANVQSLMARVRSLMPGPIACASHAWDGLEFVTSTATRVEPVDWLRGRRVAACCAIGSPQGFFSQVHAAGCDEVRTLSLPDHDSFSPRTVQRLKGMAAGCDAIIVTAKDWTKLRHVNSWPCDVIHPRLSLRFSHGETELANLAIKAAKR